MNGQGGLSPGDWLGGILLYGLSILAILLLVGPGLVVVAISFTTQSYISFPPQGFTLRWYGEFFQNGQLMDAARVSLTVAAQVMLACLLLGVPAALLAGAAFVFIEAFDNLTVALFTASPRSRPLAVELYNLVQFDNSPMVAAISSLEIGLALVMLLILARSVGLDTVGRV